MVTTAREALLALAEEFERELDVIPEAESAARLAWRQAAVMARVAAQAPPVVQDHPGPASRQKQGPPCQEECRACAGSCGRVWYPHLVHLCQRHSL